MMGELMGGVLDGLKIKVNPNDVGELLAFRNPNPVRYTPILGETVVLRRVTYHRSHVMNDIIYYQFQGHMK